MKPNDKTDPRIDDLLSQTAAQSIQLENANVEIGDLKQRLDSAEGSLQIKTEELAKLEKQRRDEAAESPSKLKEQIKALIAKNAAIETARKDAVSPERISAAVSDRVGLQAKAQKVLGDDFRVDGLDDRSLMVTVIDRLYGTGKDKDSSGGARSDDYVRAMFDSAVESHASGLAAISRVQETVAAHNATNSERLDARSARQKMIDNNQNAWRQKDEA